MALIAYTPFAIIVLISAWIPAPPLGSVPAIVNAVFISMLPFLMLLCIEVLSSGGRWCPRSAAGSGLLAAVPRLLRDPVAQVPHVPIRQGFQRGLILFGRGVPDAADPEACLVGGPGSVKGILKHHRLRRNGPQTAGGLQIDVRPGLAAVLDTADGEAEVRPQSSRSMAERAWNASLAVAMQQEMPESASPGQQPVRPRASWAPGTGTPPSPDR